MIYVTPHYYGQFHCLASDCADTCCAGWEIKIDPVSLRRYKAFPGALGNRLHNSVDWKEGSFLQYDGRCAFLNEENLCDLYAEAGKKSLCRTCRTYPRHIEEFEGRREISLSLSCIEAARIILGCEEPVRFLEKEDDKEEEYPDFDFFLYTKLEESREVCLSLLRNRALPVRVRMSMCLALARDLQHRIDRDKLYTADKLLARYQKEAAPEFFRQKLDEYRADGTLRYIRMQGLLDVFTRLEVLKKDWPAYVKQACDTLYGAGAEAYEEKYKAFLHEAVSGDANGAVWERYMEQLLVYFVFTYFCGAVYDGRAYAKMVLAVVSTLLISELAMASWAGGGCESPWNCWEEIVEIAHRYSREVEHSDDNLNTLEEMFAGEERFELERLLSIL